MREDIDEVEGREFVGGGPLNGYWSVTVSGPDFMSYVEREDGSSVPSEELASMDCYDPVEEHGRWVFRYNRAKGAERGYSDRVIPPKSRPTDGLPPDLIEQRNRRL
ncbi:MAG: hypothetical protein H0X39_18265 [Actinobacteria bacterium]|nr:hypothetical protein [Actinomycetota bacterium]